MSKYRLGKNAKMDMQATATSDFAEPIKSAIASLVSARSLSDTVYVNLPLIFRSGTIVTVRIDPSPGGFRVSDGGFAYRELEDIGAERSFAKTADKIIEQQCVLRNKRAIYVDVPTEQIERAICDVSAVAWWVVDRIYSRSNEEDDSELEEHLQDRFPNVNKIEATGSGGGGGSPTKDHDIAAARGHSRGGPIT